MPKAALKAAPSYFWHMRLEALLQTDPLKLYLSEDFRESARALVERRAVGTTFGH